MSESIELGPVDDLVVEFATDRMTGEGLPLLVDLADRGIIRILDLIFVRKAADGSVLEMMLTDLDGDSEVFSVFRGAASGLLSAEDVHEAAAALRRAGAQVVGTGRIPYEDVLAAVETG